MVKRQHTVGLAAAKGGFQLDDRLAILSADPLECLHQQTGHALGDVGAGKKLHRVTVFKGSLTPRYLRQIGGKLCVFVASLRHIRVGFHHVPPAGQTGQGLAHNTGVGSLRFRRGGNLHHVGGAFGAAVAELAQDLADLLGSFIVKGFAQARHGVQRTPCVILRKIGPANVRQLVAHTHQLFCPGAVVDGQLPLEQVVPLAVKQTQAVCHIQRIHQGGVIAVVVRQIPHLIGKGHQHLLPPVVLIFPAHFLTDITCQQRVQHPECLLHFGVILAHFFVPPGIASKERGLLRRCLLQLCGTGLDLPPCHHKGVVGVALLRPALALGKCV